MFLNTRKAIFSKEQVYDIVPIFLYTSLRNELHPFSLSRLAELEDKLDRSMELVNCKNEQTVNVWSPFILRISIDTHIFYSNIQQKDARDQPYATR